MRICIALLVTLAPVAQSFVVPQHRHGVVNTATTNQPMSSVTTETAAATTPDQEFATIFDFSRPETIDSFDRIDDVIMGGISSSAIRNAGDYATWSGVCRTDGGGFCGTRTLPFEEPLQVGNDAEGLFVDCRLTSDDEPERRVWKVSTRTERSRGEELYQAEFKMPKAQDGEEWSRVQIPFADFVKVRGARYVPDSEKMNVSAGIYQIGLTLSKFVLAQNMTELENFRPGYFELQIKSVGVYSPKSTAIPTLKTLSKKEMMQKRPLLLKVVFRAAKLFFNEQSQRRKSAMRILREERGFSRAKAILFGIRVRSAKYNAVIASLQATGILGVDAFRFVVSKVLRYSVILPLRLVSRVTKGMKKKKASPDM